MSLALVEPAVEYMLGNAILENLDRAAGDHPAARAPHAIFDQRLAAVAERAHGLHRFAGDLEARLVAGSLGDRGLVSGRKAAVGIGGGAVEEKLRAFELDRHLGELPLQALELADRPAELLARSRIGARRVIGIASEGERAGGVADALDV